MWLVKYLDGNFGPVPSSFTQKDVSATTTTLTFTADASMAGYQYGVQFSNANDTQFTWGTLTVSAAPNPPLVTAPPQDQTAPAGGDAALNVDTSGTPTPDAVWYTDPIATTTVTPSDAKAASKSDPGFQPVTNGTGNSITVAAPPNGKSQKYYAVITNGNGTVTTKTITVRGNTRTVLSNDLSNLQTASAAALASINICRQATLSAQIKLAADLVRVKASASSRRCLAPSPLTKQPPARRSPAMNPGSSPT